MKIRCVTEKAGLPGLVLRIDMKHLFCCVSTCSSCRPIYFEVNVLFVSKIVLILVYMEIKF